MSPNITFPKRFGCSRGSSETVRSFSFTNLPHISRLKLFNLTSGHFLVRWHNRVFKSPRKELGKYISHIPKRYPNLTPYFWGPIPGCFVVHEKCPTFSSVKLTEAFLSFSRCMNTYLFYIGRNSPRIPITYRSEEIKAMSPDLTCVEKGLPFFEVP